MNRDSTSGFFTGLMMGAVIGAVVALMYAPQSGTQTRRMVKDKASEIKEKTSKSVGKIKESISSAINGEE